MSTAAGEQRRWLTIVVLILGLACLAIASFVPPAGARALTPEDQRRLSTWTDGGAALGEASPVEPGAVGGAHAYTYTYDARRIACADMYVLPRTEGAFPHVISGEDGAQAPASVACHAATTLLSLTSTPRAADDFVDLASSSRRTHILQGDATGCGHLWPGAAGKTPFPQSWSGNRIMHEISDIATDPAEWRNAVPQGSRTVLTGTRGGVDIRVVVDSRTGEIITGYPTNLPRNP